MDAALRDLLDELEKWGRENDANEHERHKKVLNIDPETAKFINILIRSSKSKNILEIGTSNGYSTIWLAWAVQANGGQVTSIERNPDKRVMADENLHRAGLRERVDLQLGDATDVIAALEETYDFVLFDADRIDAPEQLRLLLPKLSPGALVLADNAISHPDQIAGYLEAIEALPEFEHIIVPVGKGLSMAYRM